jgi:CheY-like chemotaxis protein
MPSGTPIEAPPRQPLVSPPVYGPQPSNKRLAARPTRGDQINIQQAQPGLVAHLSQQRPVAALEVDHVPQWTIAPSQGHFLLQVSQRSAFYLMPPVPGRASQAEFASNLTTTLRQKLTLDDELADRFEQSDDSSDRTLVGPIKEVHDGLANPSSAESDKAGATGTQRMPHGRLSQADVQSVVPLSETGSGLQQSTSNTSDAHSGSANSQNGIGVSRSYVSASDTAGVSLRLASDARSGAGLLQDERSLVDALFVGGNDSADRSASGLEETAASDGSLLTASEQAQRHESWQKTALGAGDLLFADLQSVSTSTAAPAIRDVTEPLAGLLFAWGMTLWPGNKRQQSTILLIESDDATRDAMTVTLVREGFLVLAVATARDALNVLRTPLSPINLVLLDLDLPDINGLHLCERLRELFPKLPLMICTGGAKPESVTQLANFGIQQYLQKPIAGEKLLAAVQASLHPS